MEGQFRYFLFQIDIEHLGETSLSFTSPAVAHRRGLTPMDMSSTMNRR